MTAPKGFLPLPANAAKNTFGGWIQVDLIKKQNSPQFIDGELIAVGTDSLYLLTQKEFIVIAVSDIKYAKLVGYNSEAGKMGSWVFGGTISTLTHGFILLLTAPFLWWLGGGIATSAQSEYPIIRYSKNNMEKLNLYARFPQGLPEGIDRKTIKANF